MSEIGERIKKLRKGLGLSQDVFVSRIGITNSHLSKIEKGNANPSIQLIKSISREYFINEEWLKDGKGERFKGFNATTPEEIHSLDNFIEIMQPTTTSEYLRGCILYYNKAIVNSLNGYETKHNKYFTKEFKDSKLFNLMRMYRNTLNELQLALSLELDNIDNNINSNHFQFPLLTNLEKSTLNILRSIDQDSLKDFYALLISKAARLEKVKRDNLQKDLREIKKASK